MRISIGTLVAVLLLPGTVAASCIVTPLEQHILSAKAVFIATITTSSISKPPSELRNKERYSVSYGFEVVRRIKGDPGVVTVLSTGAVFDDPMDGVRLHRPEESRYAPGDSILVIAEEPGEVPVSSIGCAASRPWDDETYRSTQLLPAFSR